MLICPKCSHPLVRTNNETGNFWRCPHCEGRAVSAFLFRKTIVKDYIDLLWLKARKKEGQPGRPCPSCFNSMREVSKSSDSNAPNLDICRNCKLIWFDPKEYEELISAIPQGSQEYVLSHEERKLIDLHQPELIRDMHIPEWSLEAPEEGWKFLPALFGLPVEYEETYFQRVPWLTKTLTLTLTIIFLYLLRSLGNLTQEFGFIPSEPWRYGGLTFLSYFFLHGSLWHLLFNIYFLYNFGDNVEDYLGKGRYFLMLLLIILSGSLAHMVSDPQSKNPLIGLNYALSGLIVFYVLRFPYAQMGLLLFVSRFRWFRLPAFEALIGWGIFQLIANRLKLSGFTNVSMIGHLGSAFMGCLFWLIWRKK